MTGRMNKRQVGEESQPRTFRFFGFYNPALQPEGTRVFPMPRPKTSFGWALARDRTCTTGERPLVQFWKVTSGPAPAIDLLGGLWTVLLTGFPEQSTQRGGGGNICHGLKTHPSNFTATNLPSR